MKRKEKHEWNLSRLYDFVKITAHEGENGEAFTTSFAEASSKRTKNIRIKFFWPEEVGESQVIHQLSGCERPIPQTHAAPTDDDELHNVAT